VKKEIDKLKATLRRARDSKKSGSGAEAQPESARYRRVLELLGFLLPFMRKRATKDTLNIEV